MLTAAQKQLRRSGVGGSDAAAIAGEHPYKGPIDVWLEKVHPDKVADTAGLPARIGSFMEPLVRELYAEMTGRTLIDHHATGFALHDISVATAHRTYDRSVRLRSLHPGSYMLIDYSVLPDDRGHKPLGFIVISSKGKTVAAEVVKETRENEQIDGKINYQVPWQITVLGKRGDARTAIRLTAEKQTEREDDLAGLGWMARKAVGMLFHPITYTLKGTANAELQVTPAEEAITLDASVKYQYSQVR